MSDFILVVIVVRRRINAGLFDAIAFWIEEHYLLIIQLTKVYSINNFILLDHLDNNAENSLKNNNKLLVMLFS
jgi:hypothetical protein